MKKRMEKLVEMQDVKSPKKGGISVDIWLNNQLVINQAMFLSVYTNPIFTLATYLH
jgi:hypothetical protein